MVVSEAKRLKQLEDENAKLKKLPPPRGRRASAGPPALVETAGLLHRQCERKMVRYRSCWSPAAVRAQLCDLANERKRFGYRRLFVLVRQAGEPSGINRIYRLYRKEGLTVLKRRARRRAVGTPASILV